MGQVAAGTAGSAWQVGPCTLGRARGGAQKVAGKPKREEHGAKKKRVVRVAWHARWVECTRVDVGENVHVALQVGAAEEVGTLTRAGVDHEEEESWTRAPGRGEGNAAPVGAGDSPDMAHAHDGQTLVDCDAADGVADGEEAAESGNGALGGHREEMVDDVGDVAVGVAAVVEVVVDDYDVTVVVALVAGLAGLVAVAVVVYALRVPQRENFEEGQPRS